MQRRDSGCSAQVPQVACQWPGCRAGYKGRGVGENRRRPSFPASVRAWSGELQGFVGRRQEPRLQPAAPTRGAPAGPSPTRFGAPPRCDPNVAVRVSLENLAWKRSGGVTIKRFGRSRRAGQRTHLDPQRDPVPQPPPPPPPPHLVRGLPGAPARARPESASGGPASGPPAPRPRRAPLLPLRCRKCVSASGAGRRRESRRDAAPRVGPCQRRTSRLSRTSGRRRADPEPWSRRAGARGGSPAGRRAPGSAEGSGAGAARVNPGQFLPRVRAQVFKGKAAAGAAGSSARPRGTVVPMLRGCGPLLWLFT